MRRREQSYDVLQIAFRFVDRQLRLLLRSLLRLAQHGLFPDLRADSLEPSVFWATGLFVEV
jgi:hypothetical protein